MDFVGLVHANETSTRHDRLLGLRRSEQGGIWSLSAPCLAPLAKEDLGFASSDRVEDCRYAQSQRFFQPHFLNPAKLLAMSDIFKIGVMVLTSLWQRIAKGLIGNKIWQRRAGKR